MIKDIDGLFELLFQDSLTIAGKRKLQGYFEKLQRENHQLKEQLQQRDEVIEETIHTLQEGIEFCKIDSQGFYNNHSCKIAISREQRILDILNKYKNVGDNNE